MRTTSGCQSMVGMTTTRGGKSMAGMITISGGESIAGENWWFGARFEDWHNVIIAGMASRRVRGLRSAQKHQTWEIPLACKKYKKEGVQFVEVVQLGPNGYKTHHTRALKLLCILYPGAVCSFHGFDMTSRRNNTPQIRLHMPKEVENTQHTQHTQLPCIWESNWRQVADIESLELQTAYLAFAQSHGQSLSVHWDSFGFLFHGVFHYPLGCEDQDWLHGSQVFSLWIFFSK